MSKTPLQQTGLYLMGQLVGPNGEAIEGNGLFPLAGYPLALPDQRAETRADDSPSKNSAPLYFSDSSGQIQGWNNQITSVKDMTANPAGLASSPYMHTSGDKEIKAVFIPPHLLAAAVMSASEEWTEQFYQAAEQIATTSQKINPTFLPVATLHKELELPKGKRSFMPPEQAQFFIQQAEDAEQALGKTPGAYQRLYRNLYSGDYDHDFYFLRVPQVWAITLVFSADCFEGAEVTLSGQPETLLIEGDIENCPTVTSTVRSVTYYDIANQADDADTAEEIVQYVATFWITGGEVSDKQQLEQLIRFDIDLNSINDYLKDIGRSKGAVVEASKAIAALKIPDNRYALSEQVLHLPIQSIAGRSILISGDPVSVEEALFQHAPATFQHWVDWSENQPHTSEHNAASESTKAPVDVIKTLSLYRGMIRATATGQVDPLSTITVHQAFSAGLNAGQAGESYQALLLACGIDYKAKFFFDVVKDLPPPVAETLKPLSNLAEKLSWSRQIGKRLPDAFKVPSGLRQFWTTIDSKLITPLKPFAPMVDKLFGHPFSFAEIVSTGLGTYQGVQSSRKVFEWYIDKSIDYAVKTKSVVSSLANQPDADRQSLLEAEAEHKKALQEAFLSKKAQQKVLLNGHPLEAKKVAKAGEPSYLTLFFEFDSASFQLSDDDLALVGKVATYLNGTSLEMVLTIEAFTCDIGTLEYNLQLSQHRALALKTAILNQLDDKRDIWQERIIALGMGELPANRPQNRAVSRRAELKFFLHSALEYPVCRSWALGLEKSRQQMVSAELKVHESVWKLSGQSFDFAILVGASFLGPATAVAYAVYWAGDLLVSTYDAAEQIIQPQLHHYKDQQSKFSELDVVGQSLLLKDGVSFNELSVLGKAYIKRALALNGLIRLLLEESRMGEVPERQPLSYRSTYRASPVKQDLQIEEYIRTFILSDDWEIGGSWIPSFHLDEVWLETNKITRSGIESGKSFLAMSSYITYSVSQSDKGEAALEQAQRYQKYCPIHTLSDPTLDQIRSFVKKPDLASLDDNIYATYLVSVYQGNQWYTLSELVNKGKRITPQDQVRVMVILDMTDQNLLALQAENQLRFVPLGVRPVRQNIFFDDTGSYTKEYVKEIFPSSLTELEKEHLQSQGLLNEGDALLGAVIVPTYYMGRNIISGIKPMALDFDNHEWTSVFGTAKEQQDVELSLRYSLEVGVPSVGSTEKNLTYTRDLVYRDSTTGQQVVKKMHNSSIFDLTMNNKDHAFMYEETFLTRTNKKEVEYPKLFSDSKAQLFIHDTNAQVLVPGDTHDNQMEALGWIQRQPAFKTWSKATKLLILVSTKAVDADALLENAGFDTQVIPVDMVLKGNDIRGKYNINISEKYLHPLGKISIDYDKNQVGFEAKAVPEKLSGLANHLTQHMHVLVGNLAVKERNLMDLDLVDTDLYAVEVSLDYLNAAGKKMPGLRPFIKNQRQKARITVNILGKSGLGLAVSSNWVEVSEVYKDTHWYEGVKVDYDTRWYEVDKVEFEKINEYTAETGDNFDMSLDQFSEKKFKHRPSVLSVWMEAKPKMTKYTPANEVDLSGERGAIVKDWLYDVE
ncbi:OmpA family protein [Vibrio ostreicida]|uniref:OmpA family protein n=1 Tax=Vibrio ostreicida TaxID=526588 RepID=A0ABT8BTE4_9VIBR|nr:OmpA family protein [Vibrio ostreicida]MDN3610248.1 OmpA family protein [Vibrio ostreicida]NPD07735.1 OmpA family protein [Vibrio ostreicida]